MVSPLRTGGIWNGELSQHRRGVIQFPPSPIAISPNHDPLRLLNANESFKGEPMMCTGEVNPFEILFYPARGYGTQHRKRKEISLLRTRWLPASLLAWWVDKIWGQPSRDAHDPGRGCNHKTAGIVAAGIQPKNMDMGGW